MSAKTKIHGKRYGILAVTREVEPRRGDGWTKRRVECRCDCGTVKVIVLEQLQMGDHISCGCVKKERARKIKLSHEDCNSPTYRAWQNMLHRVKGHRPIWKERYTDRGIKVCERWLTYVNFREDVGVKPDDPTLSLDRIDNDKDYEPGNTRWATKKEQSNNTCRTRRFTFRGETRTLTDWCDTLHLKRKTVSQRIKMGWSVERMLTTPTPP